MKFKTWRETVMKMSMEEIAEELGVTRMAIWSWEHDKYAPTRKRLKEIQKRYDVELDFMDF